MGKQLDTQKNNTKGKMRFRLITFITQTPLIAHLSPKLRLGSAQGSESALQPIRGR